MMRRIVCCLCWFCAAMALAASPHKTSRVYMFAFSMSIVDSVAYMSDVQALDSVRLDSKKRILTDRTLYTLQFDNHVQQTYGLPNTTSAIFFSTKKPKLDKKHQKMKRKYLADNTISISFIGSDQFRLKTETWDEDTEVAPAKSNKKKKQGTSNKKKK